MHKTKMMDLKDVHIFRIGTNNYDTYEVIGLVLN